MGRKISPRRRVDLYKVQSEPLGHEEVSTLIRVFLGPLILEGPWKLQVVHDGMGNYELVFEED